MSTENQNSHLSFTDRDWEEDHSYYQSTCRGCTEQFLGFKQRSYCKICFNADIVMPPRTPSFSEHVQSVQTILERMGLSDVEYNNDPLVRMVVTYLEKGEDPLKLLGNIIHAHNRIAQEQTELINKISKGISVITPTENFVKSIKKDRQAAIGPISNLAVMFQEAFTDHVKSYGRSSAVDHIQMITENAAAKFIESLKP